MQDTAPALEAASLSSPFSSRAPLPLAEEQWLRVAYICRMHLRARVALNVFSRRAGYGRLSCDYKMADWLIQACMRPLEERRLRGAGDLTLYGKVRAAIADKVYKVSVGPLTDSYTFLLRLVMEIPEGPTPRDPPLRWPSSTARLQRAPTTAQGRAS